MKDLETTIEQAQKITLGQVDNGTLATAVNCADTLQIVRHGIVESYVIPKHLIDDMLMKMAVMECDNKRLLGERVAESIEVPKSHFFNSVFKTDMGAVTSCDMPQAFETAQEMEISRRIRALVQEPKADLELLLDICRSFKPEETPRCRYCLDPKLPA
tara:strand:+ start:521 stop:994 length:474 start_codon:yes stop_codon:yes gene_type:complete